MAPNASSPILRNYLNCSSDLLTLDCLVRRTSRSVAVPVAKRIRINFSAYSADELYAGC